MNTRPFRTVLFPHKTGYYPPRCKKQLLSPTLALLSQNTFVFQALFTSRSQEHPLTPRKQGGSRGCVTGERRAPRGDGQWPQPVWGRTGEGNLRTRTHSRSSFTSQANPAILAVPPPPPSIQHSGPIPQRRGGADPHGANLIIHSQLSKTNLLTMAKRNEEGWKRRRLLPFLLPLHAAAPLAPREFEGRAKPRLRVNFGLTVKRRLAVFSSVGSRRENVSLPQRLPA